LQVTTAGPAAAIPGLQTVVLTSAVQSQVGVTQDVNCPDDLKVVGGGGSIGGNASDKVFLTASYPLDGGRTWRVRAEEVAPGWDGTWSVTAYAICSDPLPGWEIQMGNSGPGVADFKTTFTFKCSQHKKVFSAGGGAGPRGNRPGRPHHDPSRRTAHHRPGQRPSGAGRLLGQLVGRLVRDLRVPGAESAERGHDLGNNSVAFKQCPGNTTANDLGGGGGMVDLGPYYLQQIAPNRARNGVEVKMTGVQNGGTMAQVTCSD
jgi:hypothetical protein